MSVIGVDVDGIVANFEAGYAPLLTQVSGIEFPKLGTAGWPDTWFWERASGITEEQEDKVWKELILSDDDFWFKLPPHPGAEEFLETLSELQYEHDVYFITNRPGHFAKGCTEDWLSQYGVDRPTVLISGDKGGCCKSLKVNYYIDDKNENCANVLAESPLTKCYMLAKPYNSLNAIWPPTIPAVGIPSNLIRVDTLKEFLDGIQS